MSVALFVIALIFALEIFAGKPVGKFSLAVGGPVASVYTAVEHKLSFVAAFSSSKGSLIRENDRLTQELNNMQAQLLSFESLYKEHQELLSAYGRMPVFNPTVLGNVIAKPPQSPYDILVVDVGSKDGVGVGARVYGLGGQPIGRVSESANATAKLVLFSSNGEQTQAIVERTGATIVIVGTGGGNMEAEVSPDIDIVKNDRIILPEFNGAIVALVAEIDSRETSASKRVLFNAPTNIFNLRFVEIERLTK